MRKFALATIMFAAFAAFSQPKPVVRWTAPLQRDLPADGKIALPVDLEDPKAAVAVRELTRGGKQLDRSIVTRAELQPDGSQYALQLTLDPKRTSDAGAYTLQLLVTPAAGAAFAPSNLTLVLTRIAGKLDVPSSIRVERIVSLPGVASYRPSKFAIRESGDIDVDVRPRTWTVNAQTAEHTPYVLEVREVLPDGATATNKVPGGGALLVAPAGDDLPLGVVTGTMSVDSPQLSAPVPVTLEVRSRLAYWYLFFVIAAGIFFGWLLRVHLEGKRALAAAQAAALPLWKELEALHEDLRENSARLGAEALMTPLYQAWRGKAETLTAATATAREGLTALQKKIAERTKVAGDQVSALRAAIGGPERQSGALRTFVKEVAEEIKAIAADLKGGHYERAARNAGTLNGALAGRMNNPLATWRGGIEELRTALERWKEVPELADIGPLADETPVAVTTKLAEAAAATTTLARVTESVVHHAQSLVTTAAPHVSEDEAKALQDGVDAIRSAREEFLDDPTAMIAPLDALRVRLEAIPFSKKSGGVEELTEAPEAPPVPQMEVQVDAPARAIVGQPLSFRATVVVGGEETKDVTLAWSVNGKHEYLSRVGELTFRYTPFSPNPLNVRAEVIGAGRENAISRVVRVVPVPAELFDDEAIAARQDSAEKWQTWLSAIPIVAAGMVIFSKSWIGTGQDLLTVFFWGFTTDIGVNKLIDLAKPLTKYAPTFTPAATAPPAAGAKGGAAETNPPKEPTKPVPPKEPTKPVPPKEPVKPVPPKEPTKPVPPKAPAKPEPPKEP